MKTKPYSILLALFAAIVLFTNTADATTMLRYSVPELSKSADNVIVGKVIRKSSEWNLNRTEIFTYITVEVERDVKGMTTAETVTIKELGGEVGDIGMKVIGAVEYKKDEDAVIFLKKVDDKYTTFGMMQGKFNIIRDEKTGVKKVVNNSTDKVLFVKSDGTKAAEETFEAIELDKFLSIIESNIGK